VSFTLTVIVAAEAGSPTGSEQTSVIIPATAISSAAVPVRTAASDAAFSEIRPRRRPPPDPPPPESLVTSTPANESFDSS